jgi:hypothetical protein
VFLVELLQTAMVTHTSWITLVADWDDVNALSRTPWSSASTPILNGVGKLGSVLIFLGLLRSCQSPRLSSAFFPGERKAPVDVSRLLFLISGESGS